MKRDLESVLGDILGMIPESEAELIAKLKGVRNK
jgi:hypothetical protein